MATYYTNSNNQRDSTPMFYARENLPTSYPETSVMPGNMMMYMNSGSFSDSLAGNSQQQQNNSEVLPMGGQDSTQPQQEILSIFGGSRLGEHDYNAWRDGRNAMMLMQSVGASSGMLDGRPNLQGQGLSLSLSTQIPSGMQIPSIPYRNPNPDFASFLSPNPSLSGEDGSRNASSRDDQSRNAEYLPPSGYSGGIQDSHKGNLPSYGLSNAARTVPNSKYLKAAQQLLDEVVNVRKALKQPDTEKNQSEHLAKSSKEGDGGSKNETSVSGVLSNPQESTSSTPSELSHAERQDLQNRLTKLLSMLDEVDRRYKQYYHQMQIVVSSFDAIAGCGAAKPYTALALQTISRHFRCLRDAIVGQIRTVRKSLGEQDTSGNSKGVGISRLRYVDQQLRQQRALQQLGMMQQHAWRPQRGLPESSVSILRAWLFEHFLHPYPKDSDKIMLARQTGLTRSQVSNWFINARVRLWKPMVEEMYKEEGGEAEMESNSSSENAGKGRKGEDMGEDVQRSVSSAGTERCSTGQFMDSKCDNVGDIEMAGCSDGGGGSFQHRSSGESEAEYGLLRLGGEERPPGMDDCNLFPDSMVQPDESNDRFMVAAAAYQMSEMGRLGRGSGVSLTLGLQHCDGASLPPMSGGTHHHSFGAIRGDEIYNTAPSSVAHETTDFECIDAAGDRQQQQQHNRFNSSQLLHDFVA